MSSHPIALQCIDLTKTYPIQSEFRPLRTLFGLGRIEGQVVHALQSISMEVPKGTIVGILGRNGAGKSTLLRLLGGVYHPTHGRIKTTGKIAGLFELGGGGNPELTGKEFATRYLNIMGAGKKEIPALIEDIRDFSELGDAFDHKVRTYSSGMGARLYFATVTVLQHEIYLIDEILSVGDYHFQAKSWQRMRQRLAGGASGVLVTHSWDAVLKLCEITHLIGKGKFLFSGPSDQAVVKYLDLPIPKSKYAQFSNDNLGAYVVQSGEDAAIQIAVDVLDSEPVDFSISIELLRIGIGWEIMLLSDPIPIAEHPGKYLVCISIPVLPLAPGKYSLNVFLSRRRASPNDKNVAFDTRSWTYGNGFSLEVRGPTTRSAVTLPFVVRKLGESS